MTTLLHHIRPVDDAAAPPGFGRSPEASELEAQVDRLASDPSVTALLVGERGTGKARLARHIHARGARGARPFVELRCAGPGASGVAAALASPGLAGGLVDVASGGTLFLDDVDALDERSQVALAALLGGASPADRADVRVIAATARDLVTEVNDGRFDEGLYYRLSVMPIHIPPLRARSREDVAELVARLADELRRDLPSAPSVLAPEALGRLVAHPWPGNVRELRAVLERALILAGGAERVDAAHLPADVAHGAAAAAGGYQPRTLEEAERGQIDAALHAHRGNRTHAARELGISRATLIKKIREYGLG